MIAPILKILLPATFAFLIGMGLTPVVTHYLYKYKLWKKHSRKIELDASPEEKISEEFINIHNVNHEATTPRIGGVIIWITVIATVIFFSLIARYVNTDLAQSLNFLSREQTWLPFFALIASSVIGLVDDFLVIYVSEGKLIHGFHNWHLIVLVFIIGLIGAWWFYSKLDVSSFTLPFSLGGLELGWMMVPFFALAVVGIFSGGVIDGIDGLAGGVMASMYSAFAFIAYFQDQIQIAAFCAVVTGSILVFLWYNIPPARFYLGETGMLGLTVTITTIAFLTDAIGPFLIVAIPLILSSLSSLIQVLSKKYFKKKVFKVAPLHHHFEAIGWSREKITMRYWIVSVMCSVAGIIVALA